MNSAPFVDGLFVALDKYADECGVDSYALLSGGYSYDDESYKHVRRKQDFVMRVEQLLKDFLLAQSLPQQEPELSTPVGNMEEVSKQLQQERFDSILRSIKWDVVKRWWERDDFLSNQVYAQYTAVRELSGLNTVAYQQALSEHDMTESDVEPPAGYMSVWRVGDDYDEYAKRYNLTQFTAEEKANIIRRYEKSIAQTRAAHDAYCNRVEGLNEGWLKRITNWIKS